MSWTGAAHRPLSRSVALVAVLAFASCGDEGTPAPVAATEPADKTDRSIESFLDHTLPEGTSGTAIAARDGEIVHCRGFGMADRGAGVAADCDTVYDVMSMTKQFTAAAILKLEMMGKLRVTDPISKFVGPVPDDKREITVHHLLTHTSGLIDGLGGDYDVLSREDMLAGALESELQSPPGAEHRYSNLGYSVLAAIVERVSGIGYEEFLAEHLFAPAGMTETGYVLPEWGPDQVAVEYDGKGDAQGKPFDHPWADDGPYWNLRGNGGLLSTARDMFRWHVALEADEVLDRRAKAKLFKPYVPEVRGGDSYYGYGWTVASVDGHGRVATHNGGNGWSLGRYTRFLDEGVMVFWVSNHAYDDGDWNLEELERKLTLGIAARI